MTKMGLMMVLGMTKGKGKIWDLKVVDVSLHSNLVLDGFQISLQYSFGFQISFQYSFGFQILF